MSPLEWILLATYAIGYVVSWRLILRWMLADITWGDIVLDSTVATLGAVFWPLALPVVLVRTAFGNDAARGARILAGESKQARIERMEREAERREAHIRRLEREAGIGGSD